VKVKDRRVLADYLEFRHLSYAELAAAVRRIAETPGPSKATIGHLVTGTTTGTKREWAAAIEMALGAPTGSLFATDVSRVSEDAA
jgi:hypothetical protein